MVRRLRSCRSRTTSRMKSLSRWSSFRRSRACVRLLRRDAPAVWTAAGECFSLICCFSCYFWHIWHFYWDNNTGNDVSGTEWLELNLSIICWHELDDFNCFWLTDFVGLLCRVLQMTRSDPDSRRVLEEILQEPEASSSGSVLDPVRLDWVRYWDRDAQNAILLSRLQPSSEFNTADRSLRS